MTTLLGRKSQQRRDRIVDTLLNIENYGSLQRVSSASILTRFSARARIEAGINPHGFAYSGTLALKFLLEGHHKYQRRFERQETYFALQTTALGHR